MWWHTRRNQISSFGEKDEWGSQFSRLPAAEVCASAVVMLDTPCSEVVWRVLATHYIHHFPLHFSSRASPCAITFQLESTFFYIRSLLVKVKGKGCFMGFFNTAAVRSIVFLPPTSSRIHLQRRHASYRCARPLPAKAEIITNKFC